MYTYGLGALVAALVAHGLFVLPEEVSVPRQEVALVSESVAVPTRTSQCKLKQSAYGVVNSECLVDVRCHEIIEPGPRARRLRGRGSGGLGLEAFDRFDVVEPLESTEGSPGRESISNKSG